MALIRCKNCDAEISSKAAHCHNCGRSVRQPRSRRQEYILSMVMLAGIVAIFVSMAALVELAARLGWLSGSEPTGPVRRVVVVDGAPSGGDVSAPSRATGIAVAEGDGLARIVADEALFLIEGGAQSIAFQGAALVIRYDCPDGAPPTDPPSREALSEDLRALSARFFFDPRFADMDVIELECELELTPEERDGEAVPPRYRMDRSIAEQINWANINNDRFLQLLRDINRYWLSQEKQEAALREEDEGPPTSPGH